MDDYKVTSGPWEIEQHYGNTDLYIVRSKSAVMENSVVCIALKEDAEFISYAKNNIERLKKEAKVLKSLLYTALIYGHLEYSHDEWCGVNNNIDQECNCWLDESKKILEIE